MTPHVSRTCGGTCRDVELGGRQDLFDVSGEHVDGVTTCRFTRRIDTTDLYDHSIDPGQVKVLLCCAVLFTWR